MCPAEDWKAWPSGVWDERGLESGNAPTHAPAGQREFYYPPFFIFFFHFSQRA